MYSLVFFIILLQSFFYWIIKPLSGFLISIFELRQLGIILLIIFSFLFIGKKEEKNAG